MKKSIIAFLGMLLITGCCSLKPTVEAMRNTIRDMRTRDYEKGRVTLSEDPTLNEKALKARIERLKEAENNAAVALDEEPPHDTSGE